MRNPVETSVIKWIEIQICSIFTCFSTILLRCKPSSRREIWNDHRGSFITDICIRFRRHQDLLTNGSDLVTYAVLQVKNNTSDLVTGPFYFLSAPEGREILAPLDSELQLTSSLSLPTAKHIGESRHSTESSTSFLTKPFGVVLTSVPSSNSMKTIFISHFPSQSHHNPQCINLPSPFFCPVPPLLPLVLHSIPVSQVFLACY